MVGSGSRKGKRFQKSEFCIRNCHFPLGSKLPPEFHLLTRAGKTRDLFRKIRDTKGKFHAKMGTIKDRNGMDLTEAKDIKKRWQEYTEELYKKDLHHTNNHDGVITHLKPDILKCKVKLALGSITTNKVSGGEWNSS